MISKRSNPSIYPFEWKDFRHESSLDPEYIIMVMSAIQGPTVHMMAQSPEETPNPVTEKDPENRRQPMSNEVKSNLKLFFRRFLNTPEEISIAPETSR